MDDQHLKRTVNEASRIFLAVFDEIREYFAEFDDCLEAYMACKIIDQANKEALFLFKERIALREKYLSWTDKN